MKKITIAICAVVILMLASVLVFLFVPLVGAEAVPPDFKYYSTGTITRGNQTETVTYVYDPPAISSEVSLSFCFFGHGALYQNGTYYPYTASHLQVGGEFCSTPQSPA